MARVGQAQEGARRTPRRDEPKQARGGPVDNGKTLARVPRGKPPKKIIKKSSYAIDKPSKLCYIKV